MRDWKAIDVLEHNESNCKKASHTDKTSAASRKSTELDQLSHLMRLITSVRGQVGRIQLEAFFSKLWRGFH